MPTPELSIGRQFKRDIWDFQRHTNHTMLKVALRANDVRAIVGALEGIADYKFTMTEMNNVLAVIECSGMVTDVDRFVISRTEDAGEAVDLLGRLAEIHGVPELVSSGRPRYKWTDVLVQATITV